MLNVVVWHCTNEFLAKEWPFVCHGSSAKLGCSNVGKTMLSQFISATCPSIGRTCWGLVTYSCKRWDNIRTCYRIHIMCLAQYCPNMLGQRRATSHLYIVTTLSSQRWPWTNKMSRCWPNLLHLIVLNMCLSW